MELSAWLFKCCDARDATTPRFGRSAPALLASRVRTPIYDDEAWRVRVSIAALLAWSTTCLKCRGENVDLRHKIIAALQSDAHRFRLQRRLR